MKKLSTLFFLLLMPVMSTAQTGTNDSIRTDTSYQRSSGKHNLQDLIALTPGVVNDNSNCVGFTISSNCRWTHSFRDNCTPPDRRSVMTDTLARQTVTPQFSVSEFNCPTSGVQHDTRQEKPIAINPNPSMSKIRIAYRCDNDNGIVVCVYNSRGVIVRTIREDDTKIGEWTHTIDMSDCAEGSYIVQLIQGSDVGMGRFMLLK